MKIEPMLAITTWQPWASLIACEAKLYETRGWGTRYRGMLANHAAAFKPSSNWYYNNIGINMGAHHVADQELEFNGIDPGHMFDALPRGVILSTGILSDCKQVKGTRLRSDDTAEILFMDGSLDRVPTHELLFGDFSPGRWAWRISNSTMLSTPIPAKGKQGLWRWEGVA